MPSTPLVWTRHYAGYYTSNPYIIERVGTPPGHVWRVAIQAGGDEEITLAPAATLPLAKAYCQQHVDAKLA